MATNPDLWFTIFRRELKKKSKAWSWFTIAVRQRHLAAFKRLRPWPLKPWRWERRLYSNKPFVWGTYCQQIRKPCRLITIDKDWAKNCWFCVSSGIFRADFCDPPSGWSIKVTWKKLFFVPFVRFFLYLLPYRHPNTLWGGMTTRGPQKTPPSSGERFWNTTRWLNSWPPKVSSSLERVKFSPSQRGQNELTGTITYFSLRIFVPFWDGKSPLIQAAVVFFSHFSNHFETF